MKLRLFESEEIEYIYINMVPYMDTLEEDILQEDKVPPEFEFEKDHVYQNELDTRWNILLDYITPLGKEIKDRFDFVKECNPRPSDPKNSGLSNYLDIVFTYPETVSEEEVDEFYTYTIRFSDHKDLHPENGPTEKVPLIGMKAKNIRKSGMRVFIRKIADAQDKIKQFEIKKFGKQLTFLR